MAATPLSLESLGIGCNHQLALHCEKMAKVGCSLMPNQNPLENCCYETSALFRPHTHKTIGRATIFQVNTGYEFGDSIARQFTSFDDHIQFILFHFNISYQFNFSSLYFPSLYLISFHFISFYSYFILFKKFSSASPVQHGLTFGMVSHLFFPTRSTHGRLIQ